MQTQTPGTQVPNTQNISYQPFYNTTETGKCTTTEMYYVDTFAQNVLSPEYIHNIRLTPATQKQRHAKHMKQIMQIIYLFT